MNTKLNSDIAIQILKKVKSHAKLNVMTNNVSPSSLNPDPWISNFAMVSYSEEPEFCDSIANLLNEKKSPLFVAIMRSVDDPGKQIAPFHSIHIDSRKSNKTLMVLDGDPNYSVFAKTHWTDFNIFEKLFLRSLHVLLFIIEKLHLRFLQGKISHRLPRNIANKVYKNEVYQNIVDGKFIKFNNTLPHHSHPLPTKYSVLLQVVYD